MDHFKTPSNMVRSVSEPSDPQLLQPPVPNRINRDHMQASIHSLTTIKEDMNEWQSDVMSIASSVGCRQLLSGPAKSISSGKPSPFGVVKQLQLPQSAQKAGQIILINRLSSDDSSAKNESDHNTNNTLNPYLESAGHTASADPKKLQVDRQKSNCSSFAV